MKPDIKADRKAVRAASGAGAPKPAPLKQDRPEARGERWHLRFYVAGQSPRSVAALTNLKKLCEEHLKGKCQIDVIDLMKNPALAEDDQIVVLPTLVKKFPAPLRRLVGDLSDRDRLIQGLDLRQRIEKTTGTKGVEP
jgi:circadian clock protein KaiB